jgi:hypothetical protein
MALRWNRNRLSRVLDEKHAAAHARDGRRRSLDS